MGTPALASDSFRHYGFRRSDRLPQGASFGDGSVFKCRRRDSSVTVSGPERRGQSRHLRESLWWLGKLAADNVSAVRAFLVMYA